MDFCTYRLPGTRGGGYLLVATLQHWSPPQYMGGRTEIYLQICVITSLIVPDNLDEAVVILVLKGIHCSPFCLSNLTAKPHTLGPKAEA
jgi:hypothetical protein